MKVGDIEVIPVNDGLAKLPEEYFPNADWSAHRTLFDEDACSSASASDVALAITAGSSTPPLNPSREGYPCTFGRQRRRGRRLRSAGAPAGIRTRRDP